MASSGLVIVMPSACVVMSSLMASCDMLTEWVTALGRIR